MVWEIQTDHAALRGDALQARFDLQRPESGLSGLVGSASGNAPFPQARGLAVSFGDQLKPTPVDAFARAGDFTATYAPRQDDAVSYQLNYRGTGGCLTLVLSAQTGHLFAQPNTEVLSDGFGAASLHVMRDGVLSAADVWEETGGSAPDFFLLRLEDRDVSVVSFVHPEDYAGAVACAGADARIGFHVFPRSLEKGVIRRARIALGFVARPRDAEAAADLVGKSLAAALPLTT